MRNIRYDLIKRGRIVPHPIPTRLVKSPEGAWVQAPWTVDPKTGEYI